MVATAGGGPPDCARASPRQPMGRRAATSVARQAIKHPTKQFFCAFKPPARGPPGSRQVISPPAAVLAIAPASGLHGCLRQHGLASSPKPETPLRAAWAIVPGTRVATSTRANSSMVPPMSLVLVLISPTANAEGPSDPRSPRPARRRPGSHRKRGRACQIRPGQHYG